jgi:orotate phosphoribosyltransferase
MNQDAVLELFKKKGALLQGHFLLSSGLHSDQYLQSALVLSDPVIAEMLGSALANLFRDPIDTVVSPAIGGLIIGHEVARAKRSRAIFSEKDDKGKPVLRRGFEVAPKERVLVIEDVITTGLSTGEVLILLQDAGAEIVGAGSLVNRSGRENEKIIKWDLPVRSLLTLDVKSWPQNACPLCKRGVPAVKPGSRKQ